MALSWLADLEDALFAKLPASDEAFQWEGETYLVERYLEERQEITNFVECWRDPRTERAVYTWRLRLEPGAWAGVPPPLQAETIVRLLAGIEHSRPRQRVWTREEPFTPSKYGAKTRQKVD